MFEMLNNDKEGKRIHRFLTVNGVKTSVWNWELEVLEAGEIVNLTAGDVEEGGELRSLTSEELESVPCEEVYALAKPLWFD